MVNEQGTMDTVNSGYESIEVPRAPHGEESKLESTFIKQTLAYSPIITNIIPHFKVNITKPFRGVPSTSFNDDDYQVLIPNELDSQLDAFSDDESDNDIFSEIPHPNTDTEEITTIKPVQVIVKLRSLSINGIEFGTKAEIRSSCLLQSAVRSESKEEEEDSLLVSLKSGFVLLIRLYYIPRQYMDSDYTFQTNSPVQHSGNSIYKPFVVQWWNTLTGSNDIDLQHSGFSLHAHKAGLAAVSTSACGGYRIYNVQVSNSGTILKKHFNVKVEGLLIHSCFAEPIDDQDNDQVIFFTLVFTEFRRLTINLYSWSTVEGIPQSFHNTCLPLPNSFLIPIFVVPFRSGFLFVNHDNLVIVSMANILSAEYSFTTIESPWLSTNEFPTSHYESNLYLSDETVNSILISTDGGAIYSIIIQDGNFSSVDLIARVHDSISVFSLEKVSDSYSLIYGCDNGGSKNLLIKDLLPSDMGKMSSHHSEAKLVKDIKNWAPLLDVSIIDTNPSTMHNSISDQELWGISGSGKRSKINYFKYGYPALRKSDTYEILRKAEKLFHIEISHRKYILCSFPYQTVLLEYQHNAAEAFSEISDARIILKPTIFADTIVLDNGQYLMQVSANEVLVSSLSAEIKRQSMENKILYCDRAQNYILLVVELPEAAGMQVELYRICGQESLYEQGASVIEKIHGRTLSFEPSTARLLQIKDDSVIVVGDFSGSVLLFRFSNDIIYPPVQADLSSLNPYYDSSFVAEDLVIPHDISFYDDRILIGSKDGFSISLLIDDSFGIVCESFLKIGTTPVTYCTSRYDDRLIFIHCKYLWLLNLYESRLPRRVHFDETYERSIFEMVEIPFPTSSDSSLKYFAVIRDDGLSVCSIFTFAGPCVKQVSISEPAKKLKYLDYLSIFLILCKSKNPKNRIKFFDRKTLKFINHQESNTRNKEAKEAKEGSIFAKNEYPISSCIWSIFRNGYHSKKVLIGCSVDAEGTIRGSFKMIDIVKRMAEDSRILNVNELTSFEFVNPISHIVQIGNDILFSSKNSVHFITYDVQEKRLKPVSTLATFPSEVMSIDVNDKKLFVTTKLDSVYQLDYSEEDGKGSLQYISNDPFPSNFISQARLNSKIVAGDQLHSSISIIDYDGDNYSSRISFRIPTLPRVYAADFRCIWQPGDAEHENQLILTIGVNGEIGYISLLNKGSEEYQSLLEKLKVRGSLDEELKKLDRPFFNKVSGTGLLSLNKPVFDYKGNQGKFIDYDLEEISKVCSISFCI